MDAWRHCPPDQWLTCASILNHWSDLSFETDAELIGFWDAETELEQKKEKETLEKEEKEMAKDKKDKEKKDKKEKKEKKEKKNKK